MYLEEREVAGERRLGIVLDDGEWRPLQREPGESGDVRTAAPECADPSGPDVVHQGTQSHEAASLSTVAPAAR